MRYENFVEEVYQYLGADMETIRAVAIVTDMLQSWENPDDTDYRVPLKEVPQAFFHDGKVLVRKSTFRNFQNDFAAEVFSHEIRRHDTLCGLASMYRRLKAGAEVPGVVLPNIISKMFWLISSHVEATI